MSAKGVPILTLILCLSLSRITRSLDEGNRSENRQFPYSALIYANYNTSMNSSGDWICSGTLLNDKYLLTAGLCVHGIRKFRIKLGALYITDDEEENRLEYVYDNVMTTTVAYSVANAVAIIKLNPRCTFTPEIQPISPPARPIDSTILHPSAIVSGWSENKERQARLQWLPMEIMSDGDCLNYHVATNINATLCAISFKNEEGKYRSICRNLGAALVSDNNTLIGISTKNCEEGPQIFARISWYKGWIQDCVTSNLNLC